MKFSHYRKDGSFDRASASRARCKAYLAEDRSYSTEYVTSCAHNFYGRNFYADGWEKRCALFIQLREEGKSIQTATDLVCEQFKHHMT